MSNVTVHSAACDCGMGAAGDAVIEVWRALAEAQDMATATMERSVGR